MIWAVVAAAGRGSRFGAAVPKQYVEVHGRPLLAHALDALLGHPRIGGVVVALSPDDPHWPGWTQRMGKPVLRCIGGGERADSVLAALHALRALPGADIGPDTIVLVHDAARPNLHQADLDRLIHAAESHADGAILAAPVRDTLKRADAAGTIRGTEPRESLWRALTPQAFALGALSAALEAARQADRLVTDEAMAMELSGAKPLLVEGREDNIKVTTAADLALVEFLLARTTPGASD